MYMIIDKNVCELGCSSSVLYMYCPTENNSLKNEKIVKETDIQCT